MDDIAVIDRALLAECAPTWRKLASVAGYARKALRPELAEELPYAYLALRVIALAAAGKLESQGKLNCMRFSEVRVAGGSACKR